MFLSKLKVAATVALTTGLAGTSAGVFAYHHGNAPADAAPSPAEAAPQVAEADPPKADETAARRRSVVNLRKLGLAMHEYHDVNGRFPAAAVFDPDGKPLLSWRVLVLPYLNEGILFNEFRLNEPWDSAHNKKLLERMPAVYAPVRGKTREKFATFYQVFTGKGTAFEATRGLRITDFVDGTSNTMMLAEAADAVPWTKPADMPYADNAPLPKLGGLFAKGFHNTYVDGSVQFFKKELNADEQKLVRILITRNDGMVVDFKQVEALSRVAP